VKLPDHIYEDVILLIGGLFTPFFPGGGSGPRRTPFGGAVSRIRTGSAPVCAHSAVGRVRLILYIYFVKMLVTLSWPVGMLGNMVFWYILIGTGVLYLLWPLRNENPGPRFTADGSPPSDAAPGHDVHLDGNPRRGLRCDRAAVFRMDHGDVAAGGAHREDG
jgi:hypothetical protein